MRRPSIAPSITRLVLGLLTGCTSSTGSGDRTSPGEGAACVDSSDCIAGERCLRERCLLESMDADGDGIAAAADCDDQDDRVGLMAEVPCRAECGTGTALCEHGEVGPCRCLGDAGAEGGSGSGETMDAEPEDAGPAAGADAGRDAALDAGRSDAGTPDASNGGNGERDACTPDPSEACHDGVDNDCDGLSDCDDPDCTGRSCDSGGFTCRANGSCCRGTNVGMSGSFSCSVPCGLTASTAAGDRIDFTLSGGSGQLELHGFTASGSAESTCPDDACTFQSVEGNGDRLVFSPSTGDGTIRLSGATVEGSFTPTCGLDVQCIVGLEFEPNAITLFGGDGSQGTLTFRGETECR